MMTTHEGDGDSERRPAEEEGGSPATNSTADQEQPVPEPEADDNTGILDTGDKSPEYATYRPDPVFPVIEEVFGSDGTATGPTALPVEYLPAQRVKPPSRGKLFLYSVTAHGLVMAAIGGGVWWFTNHYGITGIVPAVVGVIVTLLFILRLARGSALEASELVRKRLAQLRIEEVSDRIAGALYPEEKVRWEERQHPLSILSVGISRLMRTKRRRKITMYHLVLLVGALVASRWYAAQGDPAGFVPTLNGVIGLLILAVPCYMAYVYQEWRLNRYAITNLRLVGVVGIWKSSGSMPTVRFTDVKVSTSMTSNILAWLRIIYVPYAVWDVESAGQDQALKFLYFVREGYDVAAVFGLGKVT